MQNIEELNTIELLRKGIEALTKDLGIAGAIQFLKLFDRGSGDWTIDRHKVLTDLTIEELANEIKKQ